MKKFISASILRNTSDCTLNGISSQSDTIYIEHPQGWISEEHAPEAFRVDLIKRKIFSDGSISLSLKPSNSKRHCMAGGNFAWECDSRFRQLISNQPVAIHDRIED